MLFKCACFLSIPFCAGWPVPETVGRWLTAFIVQVVGNANKHIARVAKFLTKYGELALFPVKLQASPQRMQPKPLPIPS